MAAKTTDSRQSGRHSHQKCMGYSLETVKPYGDDKAMLRRFGRGLVGAGPFRTGRANGYAMLFYSPDCPECRAKANDAGPKGILEPRQMLRRFGIVLPRE